MAAPSCYLVTAADWQAFIEAIALLFLLVPLAWLLATTDWQYWIYRYRVHQRRRRIWHIRCIRQDARNGVRP